MAFRSAYEMGRYDGLRATTVCPLRPEEYILDIMRNNPYKGKKQRQDYVRGATDCINRTMEMRNHRMNEAIGGK